MLGCLVGANIEEDKTQNRRVGVVEKFHKSNSPFYAEVEGSKAVGKSLEAGRGGLGVTGMLE